MVPSAVVIPEINLAVLAGVFHPVGLVGMLAALVVVVTGWLCVAVAMQGRRERTASVRGLGRAPLGSEQEGAAAA